MAEQKFDVFLCHNNEDKFAVIKIAELAKEGSHEPLSKIVGAFRKILIRYFL